MEEADDCQQQSKGDLKCNRGQDFINDTGERQRREIMVMLPGLKRLVL